MATRLIVAGANQSTSTANETGEMGLSNVRFVPNGQVQRSELAAMLVRTLGLEHSDRMVTGFDDVQSESWYAGSVRTAASAGLINGYADGSFKPDASVSREELAVMVERVLHFAGTAEDTAAGSVSTSLSDAQAISTWAVPAVNTLSNIGIMEGDGKGRFAPTASVTRAEAAAVLSRTLDKLNWER